LDDLLEGFGVFDYETCENLAVKSDIGFLEFVYEDTVGHILQLDGSTDTNNPEAAEISLAKLASMKGVLTGMKNRFVSNSDKPASGTSISLG
jgi:hypothetical protein